MVVRVDLRHLYRPRARHRNLLQRRVQDMARPTPGRLKSQHDRLRRLQNLQLEIGLTDLTAWILPGLLFIFSTAIQVHYSSCKARATSQMYFVTCSLKAYYEILNVEMAGSKK